ncbi:hypothetical protein B9R80_002428 [Salmonella enterica]|nr:hypothetical protein [Salmonella enterica]
MKKFIGGGVAVAAVVGVKALLKVGFVAAIFGGSHAANTAYESSVSHVKDLAVKFNAANSDEKIEINEVAKSIIHYVYVPGFNGSDLGDIDTQKLDQVVSEAKADTVKQYQNTQDKTADLFLLNHGWKEVINWQTTDTHQTFTTYTVTGVDL